MQTVLTSLSVVLFMCRVSPMTPPFLKEYKKQAPVSEAAPAEEAATAE